MQVSGAEDVAVERLEELADRAVEAARLERASARSSESKLEKRERAHGIG